MKNVHEIKVHNNPPRYLSFEEWAAVERIGGKTRLWPLVATGYYTGFRNSELPFLIWPEIDCYRDLITLTNTEGFTFKSRESRTVPLNANLKEILLPLRKKCIARG